MTVTNNMVLDKKEKMAENRRKKLKKFNKSYFWLKNLGKKWFQSVKSFENS